MRAVLAGLTFEVEAEDPLSAGEVEVLARLGGGGDGEAFHLDVAAGDGPADGAADGTPAAVESPDGRTITVAHRRFTAMLDPWSGRGRLRRPPGSAFPLEITLRVAMAARLPLAGGLPLHAAGVVIDGRGVAFFGPSGAGKSTLAASSPYPVLSDELVAVVGGAGFALAPSGFWGTFEGRSAAGGFPLAALVELGKGPVTRWERLSREAALRRLIPVIMVPPAAALWSAALVILADLLRRTPVWRMDWALPEPSWSEIAARAAEIASKEV